MNEKDIHERRGCPRCGAIAYGGVLCTDCTALKESKIKQRLSRKYSVHKSKNDQS